MESLFIEFLTISMPKDSRTLGRGIWGRLEGWKAQPWAEFVNAMNNIQIFKRKGNLNKSNPIQSSPVQFIPSRSIPCSLCISPVSYSFASFGIRSPVNLRPSILHPPACEVDHPKAPTTSHNIKSIRHLLHLKACLPQWEEKVIPPRIIHHLTSLHIQYLFIYIQHNTQTTLGFGFLHLSESPPFNLIQKRVGILDFRWIRISKSLSLPFPQVPHPKLKQRVCLTAELSNEPATVDFLRFQVGFPAALPLIFNPTIQTLSHTITSCALGRRKFQN